MNWITSELVDEMTNKWVDETKCPSSHSNCQECKKIESLPPCETYSLFLAAEINKEIQNILDAQWQKDCSTCEYEKCENREECFWCYDEKGNRISRCQV